MRTLRFVLSYDGTHYAGSQRQAGVLTVEGELESTWFRVTGQRERIKLAGRTDARVSALRQVGFVRTVVHTPTGDLTVAMEGSLPETTCLLELSEASDDFDARRDARWRRYRYRYDNADKRVVSWSAMDQAAQMLIGERQFQALSGGGPVGPRGYVRRVLHASVRSMRDGGGELEVVGDAFLKQMVRRIASALWWVGTGRISAAELRRALMLRDSAILPAPAPADKLTLVEVGYGDYRR